MSRQLPNYQRHGGSPSFHLPPGERTIVLFTHHTGRYFTNIAPDVGHLIIRIDQVHRNTGRSSKRAPADTGYFSEANAQELLLRGVEASIPSEGISHMPGRTAKAGKGRIPENLGLRDRMLRKLHTKRGNELYKLRETFVQPVLGQLKWNRNLKQIPQRGLAPARACWLFKCEVHNLLKMHKAGAAWA